MPYNEGPFERVVNVGWSPITPFAAEWIFTTGLTAQPLPNQIDPGGTRGTFASAAACAGLLPNGWDVSQPYFSPQGWVVYGLLYIPHVGTYYDVFFRILSAPPGVPAPSINGTIIGLTSGSEVSWSGVACTTGRFGFGNTTHAPVGGDFLSLGHERDSFAPRYRGTMRIDPQMIVGEGLEIF